MTLLSVRAPVVGYATGAPVLRDVHLTAERGECIAVLGGNGAGKTALLHWLAGVLPRAGGQCLVGGRAVDSPRAAVEAGIGLVVQDPDDQLLGATVREDVELGPRNLRRPPHEVVERAAHALAQVSASALAERAIETLSYGERKRTCLAGVLAMRPALLLLDEPSAGLDPVGEQALATTLRRLAAQGTTLLVATHAVDLVPRFATRAVLLGEGGILADGPCREVLADAELLARAHVRRPWPVELWARACALRGEPATRSDLHAPLTLEETLAWLTPASS